MGFLEILTGKRKMKAPAPDRLFAMSTAAVTLEMTLQLRSSGKAAIVFQPLATADFETIVTDMEEVLRGTGEDTGTHVERTDDSFGYRWMVLGDEDFEDLVVGVNVVSQALQDGGYGERILCAVFAFRDAARQAGLLDLQLQARRLLPVRARRRPAAARLRARAAAQGPDRPRAARGGGARALVPPLGHPDLRPDQPRGASSRSRTMSTSSPAVNPAAARTALVRPSTVTPP